MCLYPGYELLACEHATGEFQHGLLLLIDSRIQLVSVQDEKHFHGCMGHTFVSICERMVEGNREAEGGGLRSKVGIELATAECLTRLCDGGLQSTKVADSCCSAPSFDDESMEIDYLSNSQIANHARRR